MGCGNTKAQASPVIESAHQNGHAGNDNNNHAVDGQRKKKRNVLKDRQTEKACQPLPASFPPPKPVAFDVNFDDDNPFKRPPPTRLTRLAPLDNAPTLSHQQLMQKLEQAEVKRSNEMERRRTISRKSSRRRLDIIQAKEFEKESQQAEIDHNLRQKEEKRAALIEERKEKARLQEERRRRVRAKARRMSEGPEEEVANLELERDMTFNRGDDEQDDVDSWLGDDDAAERRKFGKSSDNGRDDSGNYSHASNLDLEDRSLRQFSADTHESLNVRGPREEKVRMLPNDTDDFFDS